MRDGYISAFNRYYPRALIRKARVYLICVLTIKGEKSWFDHLQLAQLFIYKQALYMSLPSNFTISFPNRLGKLLHPPRVYTNYDYKLPNDRG